MFALQYILPNLCVRLLEYSRHQVYHTFCIVQLSCRRFIPCATEVSQVVFVTTQGTQISYFITFALSKVSSEDSVSDSVEMLKAEDNGMTKICSSSQ